MHRPKGVEEKAIKNETNEIENSNRIPWAN
jgi:hypothetical protein